MTLLAFLNLLSISVMMLIATYLAGKLVAMKYSLIQCIYQLLVYGNTHCFKWLLRNSYYIWYMALQVCLILTTLTQLGQFMQGNIFTKPLFIFILAPLLWGSLYFLLLSYEKRIKKLKES